MAIAAHSGRVTGRDTENICPVQEPVRLTEGEGQPQGNASRSMCSANRKKFLTPQLTSRIANAPHDVDAGEHRVQHDGMIEKRQDGMPRQKQIYCPGAAAAGAVYFCYRPEQTGVAGGGEVLKDIF